MFPAAIRPELAGEIAWQFRLQLAGCFAVEMEQFRCRDRLAVADAARRVERAEQMAVLAEELVKQAEMALKNAQQMATALEMEKKQANEDYLKKYNEFNELMAEL